MKFNNNYHPVAHAIKYAIATSFALGIVSGTAIAQEDSETAAKEQNIEKIAVVGSRSAPRSIADSPVPVDIIGGDELMKNGSTDMLNMISTTVPSLNVHANPISDAATLIRPMNLRGLPADSTLILTNGKRRHRSSVIAFLGGGINDGAQGPDVSVIPGIAIKQVEILRDGAAAQYGSDAIAGVVNFVLKDADSGGSFEVKTGEYYEGDGTSTEFAGNIGLPLTDAGFINTSFQYKNVNATSRSVQRPDAQAFALEGNPHIAPLTQVWGSPEIDDDISIFVNAGLDLGNGGEAYLFGNYSERDVTGGFYYRNPFNRGGVFSNDEGQTLLIGNTDFSAGACPTINLTDGSGNNLPFNAVNSAVNALPDNCFTFFSMFPGGFTPTFGGNITDTALTAGTKGEFKEGWLKGIMYDFSGTVGRNESTYKMTNTINASLGLDTPTEFNPGKYIQLEKMFTADFVKFVPAGIYEDLTVAFGAQWTEESFEVVAGDLASFQVGEFVDQGFSIGSNGFPGFKPEDAGVSTRRNYALYTDIEAEFTEAFLMGFALRFEDYDTFGTTLNYKVTGQYRLTDDWALRGSHSTGFRAPTVGQANVSNVQTNLSSGLLVDSALLPPTNPVSLELGGRELEPEESTSYAVGVVYSGSEIFMTLDYYRIDVDDRISQSSKINLTDANREALKAAGVKNVDSIQQVSFFTNDFDTTTQGIDFVASYSTDLLNGRASFNLAYNWNDTEVDSATAITGLDKVSRLENDLPNHRATLSWNQRYDDWSVFVRTNYYGEYQGVHVDWIGVPGEPGTEVTASAKVTFDAELSYFINDSFSVSVGAQNIFDTDPEVLDLSAVGLPNNAFGAKYYETSPMGINGGYYYLKGVYRF
ncbi:TonB-dependent receptor plug domain-containing protein [Arsukibacterium sp.]|uniref:TonB-dependent receptor plug domain-containing protein n=1 Tax=Arsukibacterium sp. TaxID=1977258 RepID=UPI00299DD7D7|nr:TonB-dependent receptor [Arsukibacterium sp.]MDX1677074.1 TonB-dependent receptor [Arsukibacterium sp.]